MSCHSLSPYQILVALIVVSFTFSCNGSSAWSRDEVARQTSPDGAVDAILFETTGGATTSFGYEIELSPKGGKHGKPVASLYGAVRNTNAYGANLKWINDHELAVQYLTARKENLSQTHVEVAGRTVSVQLMRGVEDPTAPSGGMYYNLHK